MAEVMEPSLCKSCPKNLRSKFPDPPHRMQRAKLKASRHLQHLGRPGTTPGDRAPCALPKMSLAAVSPTAVLAEEDLGNELTS